jgi:glycosyltransferase involved in cell wall biosynthesis
MGFPLLSLVVPVRDRSRALNELMAALECQVDAPSFEVVVVDDGSEPPVEISDELNFPLRVSRQIPLATSAARNRGVREAKGEVVLFVDSDCAPEPNSLRELAQALEEFPEDQAFQLKLISGEDTLVQCLEGLRLYGIQYATKLDDGHYVGFANTSGFAVRRDWLGDDPPFDSAHLRGEDTGLLMRLVEAGSPPRHLPSARVIHRPDLTTWQFLRKHFWIGYRAGLARTEMHQSGVEILSNQERGRMYRRIHRKARERGYGFTHLLVFSACYANELLGRVAHNLFGLRRSRIRLGSLAIDPLRHTDLFAQVFQAAERGRPLLVAGVGKATQRVAKRDPEFAAQLLEFDLLYAADASIRSQLWWRRLRRTHQVDAQPWVAQLRLEARRRGIQFAHLDAGMDQLEGGEAFVLDRVIEDDPGLVLISGKSPDQERLARRIAKSLPCAVIWCIGEARSAQS